MLDRARRRDAPRLVVVETERDGLDAERGEPLEELRAHPRPSESSNAVETMGAQLVQIEHALDEDDVASRLG